MSWHKASQCKRCLGWVPERRMLTKRGYHPECAIEVAVEVNTNGQAASNGSSEKQLLAVIAGSHKKLHQLRRGEVDDHPRTA